MAVVLPCVLLKCYSSVHVAFKVAQFHSEEAIYLGREVLGVLPTGHCKSLILQLLSDLICSFVHMEGKVRRDSVVALCPLDSLMSSHSHSLMIKGISTSSGNLIGGTTCVTQAIHNVMLNTSY